MMSYLRWIPRLGLFFGYLLRVLLHVTPFYSLVNNYLECQFLFP